MNPDFYARALASLNQQIATAAATAEADVEAHAKSLVEDDLPKIDSAVKSYLSLVAARSAVASDIDVLSASAASSHHVQCTFASSSKSPVDANRWALMCARTLLSAINSTTIPDGESAGELAADNANNNNNVETKSDEEEKVRAQLQKDATKVVAVLWNKLVMVAKGSDNAKANQMKPSKVLGRESLLVAYPYIEERLRRGALLADNGTDAPSSVEDGSDASTTNPLASLSDELLPPVSPPTVIDIGQWNAFYTEFGHLLGNADKGNDHSPTMEDDSALLWSCDKGSAELQQRRELRSQRATEALASVDGAKAAVADAFGASAAGSEETKQE
ncbi:hypothetical protein ACHAXT_008715 [Thalassiosira profunda]